MKYLKNRLYFLLVALFAAAAMNAQNVDTSNWNEGDDVAAYLNWGDYDGSWSGGKTANNNGDYSIDNMGDWWKGSMPSEWNEVDGTAAVGFNFDGNQDTDELLNVYQIVYFPAGIYTIKVQAFYREGTPIDNFTNHFNRVVKRNAWLYADILKSSDPESEVTNSFQKYVRSLATSEQTEGRLYTETGSWKNDYKYDYKEKESGEVTSYYCPCCLPGAIAYFLAGKYDNELKIILTDGAYVRLGFRKTANIAQDWLVFTNFRIVYNGKVDSVAPTASKLATDGTAQYFYNVEAKGFLVGANDWGTRASIDPQKGYLCRFEKNGDTYQLATQFNNKWHALDCQSADNIWVDGEGRDGSGLWTYSIYNDGTFTIGNANVDGLLSIVPSTNNTRLYMSEAEDAQSKWIAVAEADFVAYQQDLKGYNKLKDEWMKTNYSVGNDIVNIAPETWEGQTGTSSGGRYERYNGSGSIAKGNVLTQTLKGLKNGTYEITLELSASFTSGRGFECPTGEGLVEAFANDKTQPMSVIDRGWVNDDEFDLITFIVNVTDGVLTYGIRNLAPAGNWYLAKVKSIIYIAGIDVPVIVTDPEPYAVLSNNNTILTFYYDNQKEMRGGMDVGGFVSSAQRGWDGASESITSVIFDASFANCTTLTCTAYWFYNCQNLTTFSSISNLNTANVTDMYRMFWRCSALTNLDVSGFETKEVVNMSDMFYGCSSLTNLDLSGFNTENVMYMGYMFYGCSSLTSLDVSNFNTSSVTNMTCLFDGCSGLTNLDVSNFNIKNVTFMGGMFEGCSGLTSLDVSNFNTKNVTKMGLMFSGCSGLTSLDLSNFNTESVTMMLQMFRGCNNLQTIFAGSNWSTAKVTESNDMFTGCTKLVGGRGTTYNANHIDAAYAHIDGGTSNPGYFTGKNVTTVCEMPQIAREGTSNYIIMSCATAGASIYYTTNGTMPTENNTRYTGPIIVSKNCTIKAIAIKDGYESSSVATYNVNWFKVARPTFNYSNLQLNISTATSGATIYYTTNGTTPTTSSTKYTGAISLTSDCTVKAIAVKDDYTNSDVASFSFVKSNYTCQAPQISRNGTGNQVVMTCATSGASIYYTTDGTTPTQASVRYTGAITFDHNQTIRAVAIKDGMFNSSQTQFSVDWFKVATPTFSYSNLQLTISTATLGATIYYTIDGSNPLADLSKAIRYTVPVRLEADAQVKSVAVKTDFNNSDVASYTFVKSDYTCKSPQIQRDGSSDRVMMSSATENAVIYYTTDGSEPTTTSTRYTGPVTMTYNCTVRAIAVRSDMFSSGVSEFAVDWLTISGVTVAYNNGVLTLTCASTGAEIHYEIGGKDATKSSPLYTGPITLIDNREVRYVVYVTGKEPVSGSYTPTDFTCAPVTLSYDGLNIILSTAEEGATIYYTTDGSIPTTSSEIYRGKTPLSGLCTVNAFAEKTFKNNSEMMQIPITYFFDGRTVFQSEPGHVGDAVQWRGTEGMQELKIQCEGQGVVNDKDLSALRAIKSLKHLNLVDARFENNSVPNGAFAGMNIVSVEFPGKNITTLGNVFSGCEHLAAIIWNARTPIVRTTATAAGITNPNLLLYVDNEAYAPNDVRNVIANGSASSIVLTDSGSYYCPQEFQAQVISYSHTYTQITGINKRSGWETIALPFDVQSITHELQGRIAPFAADDAMARPFWLGELSSSGFKRAAEIKANTPYIISMPNNEVYGSAYILAGKVTFEASNMTVPATNIITTSKGDHVFTPCFDAVEASQSVYAINKNDQNSNHVEGSVFLPYTRDVKPFEAYIAVPTNGVAPRYIPIRDDSDTGIEEQPLSPLPRGGELYNLQGQRISVPSDSSVSSMLPKGVYIMNGKKIMVK